jgi:hypothetical protein
MLRKILCAVAVVALTLGVATAETLKGRIVSVDAKNNKVKFMSRGADEEGEAKEYKVSDKVKVYQGKEQKEIEGGLKASVLKGIGPDSPRPGMINVENGVVTEITVAPMRKKKKESD